MIRAAIPAYRPRLTIGRKSPWARRPASRKTAEGGGYNVEALTDRTGKVVERYAYNPYGAVTFVNSPGPDGKMYTADDIIAGSASARGNSFFFQGRELDGETGNYYYRYRYYSAWIGRFVSRDPIRLKGGDPNVFRFESGNTPLYLDPVGLSTFDPDNTGLGACREPTPYNLGMNFLTGSGAETMNFGPTSCYTKEIASNSEVLRLRGHMLSILNDKCRGGCSASGSLRGSYGYQDEPFSGNLQRRFRMLKDAIKIATGFADINVFVGGFDFVVVGFADCKTGKGNLGFSAANKTGIASATSPPDETDPARRRPDRPRPGPLGTIYQNFNWDENATVSRNPKCDCEK